MAPTDQAGYDVRFEWGPLGLTALRGCRAFVVVDVLSFSTCVSIAIERGAVVLPHRSRDDAARSFADQERAILAGSRWLTDGYSLSPRSLLSIPQGTRIVLPSPNGATLSLAAAPLGLVLAGCLRNRVAVARRAGHLRGPIAVIAAGERWPDGSLRPCFEDLIGAGAVIAELSGSRSPEAEAAEQAFSSAAGKLEPLLLACASGRELVERGFALDVHLAAVLDCAPSAAELRGPAFVPAEGPEAA